MVRRIAHTSHHRGQQMALLRMLNREVYSTYGPTADTGGLAANQANVVYAFRDLNVLVADAPNLPCREREQSLSASGRTDCENFAVTFLPRRRREGE